MDNNDVLQEILQTVRTLDSRMSNLEKDNVDIRNDLQSLKADVAQIPDMRRDINLILEGQQGINDKFQKLDKMAEDVEEIKIKVNAVEEVTRSNTSQIKELRIAK